MTAVLGPFEKMPPGQRIESHRGFVYDRVWLMENSSFPQTR